ncbi:MAG TPA: 50S ribosomal protein L9 [Terriglobia bacterium]|nr:50S ribosomal protein L9 [Terriglobia bacterium]
MEVILLAEVENLGSRGQIVKVAGGYGRNHLLPKKLAVAATPQNRKWVEQQRVRFLKVEAKERGDAEDLSKLMNEVQLTFKRKTGDHGSLFGSVTSIDIAEGLGAKGYHIDRRKVQLLSPIKSIGEHQVGVKLHREVTAQIKVTIESENAPVAAAPPAEPVSTPPASSTPD